MAFEKKYFCVEYNPETIKGPLNDGENGLFGRLPPDLRKMVRKIMDAPTYDFGAMELLDALKIEWR